MLMELPGEVREAAASKHRDQWGDMSWAGKLQAVSAIPTNELDPAISHKVAETRRKQKMRTALDSTAHPDDDDHSKHGLIVAALEALRGGVGRGCGPRALIPTVPTLVPASSDAALAVVPFDQFAQGTLPLTKCASPDHPDEIAIWIDWCCLDQDASSLEIASSAQAGQRQHGAMSSHLQGVISSQLQAVAPLIASCDIVLTPIADPAHAAWDYPAAWAPHGGRSEISQAAAAAAPPTSTARSEGLLTRRTREQNASYHPQGQSTPLEQYAAAGWASYWGRAWCGTEALLSQACYPYSYHPMVRH